MTYQTVAFLTQTGVLVFFMMLFGAVLFYALAPRNKDKFTRAAHMPLDDESYDGKS